MYRNLKAYTGIVTVRDLIWRNHEYDVYCDFFYIHIWRGDDGEGNSEFV